ncbi:MAG: hypothetical protein GEU78_02660 [Actinobacteria bacterium]|nr:hypothetical protein [Actinomycetota bacterium]
MQRNRIAAALLSTTLLLSGGMVACDREDEADIREGVEDAKETGKKVGDKVEDAVDDAVDTDGKDD